MNDLPSRWYYVSLCMWLVVVLALALWRNVYEATLALAASMLVLGIARIFTGPRVTPHIRARWFDAAALIIVALMLFFLARYGNNPVLS
ncbi:Uncharacterised protein [Chlamydia trachomatis]|nr:Uncharacterised protein [Chlamydia trachomatis]